MKSTSANQPLLLFLPLDLYLLQMGISLSLMTHLSEIILTTDHFQLLQQPRCCVFPDWKTFTWHQGRLVSCTQPCFVRTRSIFSLINFIALWTKINFKSLLKDVLCVADREGKKIDCVGAGLRFPQFLGQISSTIPGIGRVYGLAGRGSALLAVTGKGSVYDPPVRVSSQI